MKLLLDTNLLIDYLGRKKPFFDDAQKIIAAGYFHDASLFVSAGSVKDAFYVLNHYVPSERIQRSITALFEVVRPVVLDAHDLSMAASLLWDDFEDCLIALSAVKTSANYLITRDQAGFSRSMVPALSPSEWLNLMEQRGLTYDSVVL